ncbi:MAG: DJ-1/PfpI family protein [Anaerolineaceae bacterium]|nr:DJ-1/PfpI family protein [Anaerolineaceae bacterium]
MVFQSETRQEIHHFKICQKIRIDVLEKRRDCVSGFNVLLGLSKKIKNGAKNMAKILMIIAPERFRDEEFFIPKEEFEKAGHETFIASTKIGVCKGSRGGSTTADLLFNNINPEAYDAVVFVGGGGSKLLFNDPDALNIATKMNKKVKVVSAICLAPVILANAGVLQGKNATVSGQEAKTIESKGAKYTGPGVTVDGNIITGNAPKSSRLFGQKICELLKY